jgi:hypothetical protein
VLVTAQALLASRAGKPPASGAAAAGGDDAGGGGDQVQGLAASFALAPPDGEPDENKKFIRKLVITAVPAPPPDPKAWSGPGLRTSTARVRSGPELAAALQEGLAGPAAGHALEGRGEQGVNRALRALLAVQAEAGAPLAVWPWYGAVEDVAAAARGEARSVPGTVLLVRREEEQ